MTQVVGAEAPLLFSRSTALQERLQTLVPGGADTYARGPDQYPDGMAPVIVGGRGARVVDVDSNELVEYGMGLCSVTLGHGYEPVVRAVITAASGGVSFTRPSVLELEAAGAFVAQVPGAEMVKFFRNGSDAATGAIRLARTATGRRHVALCRTQPVFSTDDWFIGTPPKSADTLDEEQGLTLGFDYNDLDSVRMLLDQYPGQIACVVLEPATSLSEPAPGFLEGLRALADAEGFVLVFDEMITGMRWSTSGAQGVYGVLPDLSTWGKALGNGFPVCALCGRRDLMELGGLRPDRDRVFLLSTTDGPEASGLAAFLAVSQAYRDWDVVGAMERQGARLRDALIEEIAAAGLADHVQILGRPSCLVFATLDAARRPSQAYRTLFLQELLRHGVLGQSFVISAAHTDPDLALTVEAVRRALPVYARAVESGTTDELLVGRPITSVLRACAEPRRLPDLGPRVPAP